MNAWNTFGIVLVSVYVGYLLGLLHVFISTRNDK
jgi:hypothetical protein